MRKIAAGVWQLTGWPQNMFNVYLAEDVLFDAATRWAKRRLLRQLRGRRVSRVALTHCHPDHQGVVEVVCEQFGATLLCPEADVPVMEGRAPMVPDNWLVRLGHRCWSGPPYRVSHSLKAGDEVAGFRVVHAPGHTPGHSMFFREADGLVLAGDVIANINFLTGKPGLREPPPWFSVDWRQNRRSLRTLLDLRPKLICFGHGPPLRDVDQLERYCAARGV